MFDLFRRKDTTLRYVLGFLLGLVALSMVVTLIPGFGSGSMGGNPNDVTVATVCGEALTAREVRINVSSMLQRQQLPPESAAIFIPQFIDQLVNVRGMACFAEMAGMRASDMDLALMLQKQVPDLFKDGKFVGSAPYAAMLQSRGSTIKEFEELMRKDVTVQRLRSLVLMSATATPKEVEDTFREAEEKVKLEYVVVDPILIGRTVIPTEADARAEYDAHKSNFKVPSQTKAAIFVLDQSRVMAAVSLSEAEERRSYEENRESFRVPEAVKVRHILFMTKDKPAAEDAKMKAAAEKALQELKGGAKFEDLAKKYSEDPGSKANGGEMGFLVKGQAVKNFEDSAFSLPLKTVSAPVKTEFGYHLIEVLEKQQAGQKTFDEVRPSIQQELRRMKASNALVKSADDLRAELQKSPSQAEALGAKYFATVLHVDVKGPDTPLPGLGPKPELINALSALKKAEVTQPVTSSESQILLGMVEEIVPERPATFEEAKRDAMATVQQARIGVKVKDLMNRAADGLKTLKGDVVALGKQLDLPVKQTQEFGRDGFADGVGPSSAVLEAFSRKPGEALAPVTVDGKWFFVRVIEKKEADMSLLPARRAEMVNRVKNRKASERADIFEDTVVRRLISDGKIKVNEAAKKAIASSFGS
jgi:peptidyl-prolyl cis-trans isomerase D